MLISDKELRIGPAADQAKNTLAGLPSANRGTNFRNLADKFHTRNLRGKAGWRRIFALALQQVSTVERRRADAHKDLFIVDKRFAHGADFQHLGAAIG